MDTPPSGIVEPGATLEGVVDNEHPFRPARVKLRQGGTTRGWVDHPEIAGHSYKELNTALDTLFLSGDFDYGMAAGVANQIAIYYYHYDQFRPLDIPPERYVAFTRTLINDLSDPKSNLWAIVNWAHVKAYGRVIGKDHQAAIVQETIVKLNHDIHDRLKPQMSSVDAAALRDLAFDAEPLRQSILTNLQYWAADEELHPVHAVLRAGMKLDPALAAKGSEALNHHILNKEGMGHLEMRLQTLLAKDKRDHGNSRGSRLDKGLIKQAENIIVDFLFYSQPGIRPVDIDPYAFSNKALETYFDARYITHGKFQHNLREQWRDPAEIELERRNGSFQPERVPELYGTENKYNVLKAFSGAFHKVYGRSAPTEAMVELSRALIGSPLPEVRERNSRQKRPLPRIDHEVLNARFIDPLKDSGGRDWFLASRQALDDGRAYLLHQMELTGQGRADDPAIIDEMAALTVDHYRFTAPNFWHHARGFLKPGQVQSSGIDIFSETIKNLESAAERLGEEAGWKPFVAWWAGEHDGKAPPPAIMKRYHQAVLGCLARQVGERVGFDPFGPRPAAAAEPSRFNREAAELAAMELQAEWQLAAKVAKLAQLDPEQLGKPVDPGQSRRAEARPTEGRGR